MSRRLATAIGVIVAVVGTSLPVAAACPQKTARIVGSIFYSGGPPPGTSRHREPGSVTLLNSRHRVVARHRVTEGDRFHFSVRPGRYYIRVASGDATCPQRAVRARADRTTTANVTCSIH